jgi:hypothetical protein
VANLEWVPPADWRERLNRAYAAGRDRNGLPCCGTTDVHHLPGCQVGESNGTSIGLRDWLEQSR